MLAKVVGQKGLCLLASGLVFIMFSSIDIPAGSAGQTQESSQNNNGWPTRRVGGGSREGCGTNSPNQFCVPVMAMIPEYLAVTATDTPTLFFRIPSLRSPTGVQMEFVLRDGSDRLVYETTFAASPEGGSLALHLPKTGEFQGLKIDENYHWYFSIIYDPTDRAHDDVVEGWLRREVIPESLARQLQTATPMEQVALYEDAQLWTEAISTLALLRQSQPNNPILAEKWQQLLGELELTF